MNITIDRNKLYLLKFNCRLNISNILSENISWYYASLSLLNALIDDSYSERDYSLDALIKFVDQNPEATNIYAYLKSLPDFPEDLLSLSRDKNKTTYEYHGYLTMLFTEHMYSSELIYNDLDNSLFFKDNNLDFNENILTIENHTLKLIFSVNNDTEIVFDSIIDGDNIYIIDFVFSNQESFFNYIKNYETIPFNKDLIHMIYF